VQRRYLTVIPTYVSLLEDDKRGIFNRKTHDDRGLEFPKSPLIEEVGKEGFVGITFEAPLPKIPPMRFLTPSIWSDGVGVADALLVVEVAGGSLSLGTPRPLRLSIDSLGKSEDPPEGMICARRATVSQKIVIKGFN
jgi:hypothetical protein